MKRFYLLSIVLLISSLSYAQLVTTYVGTGSGGYTASGTTKLSTNIEQPWGAALDGKGNAWITTEGGHEIKMLQLSTGNVYIRSGAYGLASFVNAAGVTARFYNPRGIAVGPGDTIFIADFNNCAIRKMTPYLSIGNAQTVSVLAGKFTGSSTLTSYPGYANGSATVAQFDGPSDVAVDANGNVYVADYNNNAIRKVTRAGVVTTLAGQGPTNSGSTDGTLAQAKFNHPTGLCLVGNDTLYVADNGNGSIRRILITGNSVSTIVSGLYSPNDVFYKDGVIYITDQHRIRKYANSTLTTFAGSNTINDFGNVNAYGTNARFYNVKSIFYNSSDGYFWVADQDNHYIKRVSLCPATNPTITLKGNDTICQGSSVTLKGPSGNYIYAWLKGGSLITGATKDSLVVTSAGTYSLSLKNNTADSCTGLTNSVIITVISVSSSITYSTPLSFCAGDNVVLKGPAGYTSYLWSTKDTTQNITVTNSDTITLKVSKFFCSATSTAVITTVKPIPTSTFTSSKNSVCLNDTIKVTYTGSAASGATYTWSWNSGIIVSGTGMGPYVVKWGTTGTKQITLQVTENGCTSVLTQKSITVNALPTSTFTVQTPVCALTFDTITYTGNGTSSDSYNWTFDTATIASGTGIGPYEVFWANAGTKSVTLVVTDVNGCISAKTTKSVVVNKTPTSTFTAKKTNILTNEIDTITYTGNGGTAVYIWDFDSPDQLIGSGKGPYRVAWFTAGVKTVTLTVTEKGCSSTYSLQITVSQPNSKPIADFSANKTTLNAGESVNFTDISANTPTSWKWTFTGGTPASSTNQNPSVVYNTAGVYAVTLEATNAFGSDTKTKNAFITVNSVKPMADFSASATTITEGGTVNFTDLSTNTPTSWKWTFTGGTPASSTVQNPSVVYNTAGVYSVSLEATNANGTGNITKNAYITVNAAGQKPVADFTSDKTSVKASQTVTFTDLSTNSPIGLVWSFQGGTPATSTATAPVITYNTAGTYNVQLIAINAAGSDTMLKTAYLKVTVGINDNGQNTSVRIYPSPTKDVLYIESAFIAEISSVEVMDITGRIRYAGKYTVQGNQISVDLTGLPKGLYMLKLTGNDLSYTGKFSKE